MVDRLLRDGHAVAGIDNLSTGRRQLMEAAGLSRQFEFHQVDLLDGDRLPAIVDGADIVFHFAANADVRFGTEHPTKDFEQNVRATLNVLEAMRLRGVKRIVFSSTASVYGDAREFPTPEFTSIPVQTSLYGASKMAAEGFIQAYCEGFGMQGWIFRFVSLLGERYSHGHVVDFFNQLRAHPEYLDVLGDGSQRKSYLYVADCVEAILTAIEGAKEAVNVLNLGTSEHCTVKDSIGWITERLQISPEVRYAGGNRGWIGDSPFIFLNCEAMRSLGWAPTKTIKQSIVSTVEWLLATEP
jgi:UDP-glucose 4-epimerase